MNYSNKDRHYLILHISDRLSMLEAHLFFLQFLIFILMLDALIDRIVIVEVHRVSSVCLKDLILIPAVSRLSLLYTCASLGYFESLTFEV